MGDTADWCYHDFYTFMVLYTVYTHVYRVYYCRMKQAIQGQFSVALQIVHFTSKAHISLIYAYLWNCGDKVIN